MTLIELAPFLFIGIIVLINIALWASLSSAKTREQMDMLTKANKSLRHPWEKENNQFHELNLKVQALHQKDKAGSGQNDDDDD